MVPILYNSNVRKKTYISQEVPITTMSTQHLKIKQEKYSSKKYGEGNSGGFQIQRGEKMLDPPEQMQRPGLESGGGRARKRGTTRTDWT